MSDEENHDDVTVEEDTLKILIATDCHLGYGEKSNTGDDSFTTFEEILKYGKQYNVDFILLGGDLFHDNKPTQSAVMKCIDLLRKYCLGTRPNKFQFLTDPRAVFKHCSNKIVNFEDPNLNVEIPVFSIHGNHDDPSGAGQIGSLDLLSVTGLINYFGKWTNLNEVKVLPLLFKKGCTHLALYGLSYIKDQRLARLLRDGKVDMLRSNEIDECFNVFVLHQNRAKHSDYSFVPEESLPNFLDFILWGHEHECRIDPETSAKKNFRVCQPGSPVATSLCQGESVPKHVGILHVHKTSFKLQKLKLKTVRPFVFDTIYLTNNKDIKISKLKTLSDSIEAYVDDYIENVMMPRAAEQLSGDPAQPKLPLLRLRVIYSEDDQKFDTFRLDQKYLDQVANSSDIILLRKQKVSALKREGIIDLEDDDDAIMEEALGYDDDEPEWSKTVQGGIRKYFLSDKNKNKLNILSVTGLNEALSQFVDKGDKNAFEDVIEHQMKIALEYIKSKELTDAEDITNAIDEFRQERDETNKNEEDELRQFFNSDARGVHQAPIDVIDDAIGSDDQSMSNDESPVKGRGRARGRGRGTRGAAQPRGRAKASASRTSNKAEVVTPVAKITRVARQPAQNTQSLKQASIASHFPRSQTSAKRPAVYISETDSE